MGQKAWKKVQDMLKIIGIKGRKFKRAFRNMWRKRAEEAGT
jgi:hypothetical protein